MIGRVHAIPVLLLAVLLLAFSSAKAQRHAANTIHLNNSLNMWRFPWTASLSYDRLLGAGQRLQFMGRIGAGNHRELWNAPDYPPLHGGLVMLFDQDQGGVGNHYWELFMGGIGWLERDSRFRLARVRPSLEGGYRYQPRRGGWMFRVFVGTEGVGVGGGYAFGR